jgi:hypothetical protein
MNNKFASLQLFTFLMMLLLLSGQCNGMVSQPKVSRSTLSQIEKLVGKLPPWMKPNTAAVIQRGPTLPHSYHKASPSGVFPMSPVPRVFSPPKFSHELSMQPNCFAVPHAPSCYQASHNMPNHYQCDIPRGMPPLACEIPPPANGMPPLAYEPSPRTRIPAPGIIARLGNTI